MATAKERLEFAAMMAREFPNRSLAEVDDFTRRILRLARMHGNLAVEECNGPGEYVNHIPYPEAGRIIDEWQKGLERRQERCEKRIRELCAAFGVLVDTGGDPRGYTVKLHLPSKRGNTWGGSESGWGVPS